MANITIKEVAHHAGVSIATVSRVLNNHAYVTEDIRLRVQEAMSVLGYEPNRSARRLRAQSSDILGLIIPDIPMFEYESEYGAIVKKYKLDFIFLITPETSEERIRKLDALSSGFLYAVSSSSITGSDKDFSPVESYLQRLKNMQLKNPVLVGFGIKDKATFEMASRYTNGAIIGSAYIKALEGKENVEAATKKFLNGVLN